MPYEVVRADHDYLELLVKVKDEDPDPDPDPDPDQVEKDQFFNLTQLAEVSLAMEGKTISF